MLRILIADDYEIVRHGIRALIASNSSWELCGEAPSGTSAYAVAMRTKPDILVLDVSMPGLGGISLARMLREDLPETMLLAFTMRDDADTVKSALAAGVKGYVLKSDGERQLAAGINALGAKRNYFSPSILEFITDAAANDGAGPAGFTAREVKVTELIAKGMSNRAIADLLGISVKTVESHRASALRKAGVHTGPELVRFAIRHQLIA
ncbi:MAG TPA: response regulator transcription factor [Hyphomonadaceae bacterium]|jgi:DNA-binding NarL/FixJ family response regulator